MGLEGLLYCVPGVGLEAYYTVCLVIAGVGLEGLLYCVLACDCRGVAGSLLYCVLACDCRDGAGRLHTVCWLVIAGVGLEGFMTATHMTRMTVTHYSHE